MRLFAIGDTHLPSTRGKDMHRFGWSEHPLPLQRAWDAAVRQAPVLVHNLASRLEGRAPRRHFHPQRGWLSLGNAGDRTALGAWGGHALHGRVLWHLKDAIDRRFMHQFL